MIGPEMPTLLVWISVLALVVSKNLSRRQRNSGASIAARPWNWFVPDLVTMFMYPTRANSAVLLTATIVTSSTSRMSFNWLTALSLRVSVLAFLHLPGILSRPLRTPDAVCLVDQAERL